MLYEMESKELLYGTSGVLWIFVASENSVCLYITIYSIKPISSNVKYLFALSLSWGKVICSLKH